MIYEILTLKNLDISDFSHERNKLLQKGDKEWLLFLDTDEVISAELKNELNKLKPESEISGYYVKRKGTVEEKILRLAKKDSGKWIRCVHEVWRIKGKTKVLKSYILHNEDKKISNIINKTNFYSTLHAKANKSEGKISNVIKIIVYPFLKFIQTYFFKKAYKKGIWGFVFSLMQSFQSFLSWTKLYFLHI